MSLSWPRTPHVQRAGFRWVAVLLGVGWAMACTDGVDDGDRPMVGKTQSGGSQAGVGGQASSGVGGRQQGAGGMSSWVGATAGTQLAGGTAALGGPAQAGGALGGSGAQGRGGIVGVAGNSAADAGLIHPSTGDAQVTISPSGSGGSLVPLAADAGRSDSSVPAKIGVGGTDSPEAGTPTNALNGDCCPDKNCLCHGDVPTKATSAAGPFKTASYAGKTGTIYYPTDATPPLAGIALCGGFTNSGPEMAKWGPFYASWGMVTVITTTGPLDFPDIRATALLNSIKELKSENAKSGGPLFSKMSDRYGISGYSMGGGGTTIGSTTDPTLKTGIGLAPWGPVTGMKVATLFLCGDADSVAGVTVPTTASGTPSLQVVIDGYTHFNWFGPTDVSGHYALSWQKVYLEGDTRWKPFLAEKVTGVASMKAIGQ